MYRWENGKFSKTASGVNPACGKIAICIDDTQGFDGVRYYIDYVPTLRSQRSGLKVAYIEAPDFNLMLDKLDWFQEEVFG